MPLLKKKKKTNSTLSKGMSPTRLSCFVTYALWSGGLLLGSSVDAKDYFNPALLSLGLDREGINTDVDLTAFENSKQLPGKYLVTLIINGQELSEQEIDFISDADKELIPQLTIQQYEKLGLRIEAVSNLAKKPAENTVIDIREYVPSATIKFDYALQRLEMTFPQLLTNQHAKGYVDPADWDQGLPAALLNYAVSGNQTRDLKYGRGTSQTLYANLRGGFNLGAWRLRSYGTYQQRNSQGHNNRSSFDVISTYLQRDIHAIKGQLTLGDSITDGDVFDSIQFQGGQLVSDDGMLPANLRSFAPVVRGVSESGAEITVRQNGSVIYQAYVPPGPFEINDLYPSSLSGDLIVTVKESDGSERTFSQPFSSLAIMQREGQMKYAMTIGKLRDNSGAIATNAARFVQGTLVYGLPGNITVYGGLQLAKKYLSASVGVGLGMGQLGALSMDVTHSDTTLPHNGEAKGQSYRLRYSRDLAATGTSISLAAYRYSTEGYYNLQDAFTDANHAELNRQYRPRGEFQVMLHQSLGDAGSMYLTGSKRDFWNKAGEQRNVALGYSTSLWGMNYGLSFSHTQDTDSNKQDRRVALTASIPLSRWLSGDSGYQSNSMMMNYGTSHSQSNGTMQQLGLSGSALDENQLNYNLSHGIGRDEHTSNLSATYRGSQGAVSAGYNRSSNQEQLNYGARGGVVAHPYGVTFAQEMGETVALVRAPSANNIKITNRTGLSTDWNGYAVMPQVQPYARTSLSLNPNGLASNVALDKTSTSITPTRGAVVLADFPTQRGHQIMMTVSQESGAPIPFGATAKLAGSESAGVNTGIVGEEGQLYMSGMPDDGVLEIQWGNGRDKQCKLSFNLAAEAKNQIDGIPLQVHNVCSKG